MKIAVTGAGLTGLTAGCELSGKGHDVTVFEEAPQAGGLASAFKAGSENLDKFYHHVFTSDSHLLNLLEELSISEKLKWYEPKNAIYIDSALYPFTTPFDLLAFRPLSFISRIRTGLLVLSSGILKNYRPLELITAREWIVRRSGRDAYEKVWGPLLKSKFDIDAGNVSGTWIWNKFKLRGSSRGKNISRELLGYMDGGFSTLVDGLVNKIDQNGGTLCLKSPVRSIRKNTDGSFEVSTGLGIGHDGTDKERSDKAERFDKVLFTAAPELLADVCEDLPGDYRESLKAVRFKANLCLALELRESLSPYYWITISQEGFPFVLIIEHTNLTGLRGYGSHIVYLSRYLDASDPLFSASDDEITELFIKGLKAVFPGFDPEDIIKSTLSRTRYAQPVVTVGYEKRIPDIKTPLDGLYLASMPQIYPEDRGLNYAVGLGERAAGVILGDL